MELKFDVSVVTQNKFAATLIKEKVEWYEGKNYNIDDYDSIDRGYFRMNGTYETIEQMNKYALTPPDILFIDIHADYLNSIKFNNYLNKNTIIVIMCYVDDDTINYPTYNIHNTTYLLQMPIKEYELGKLINDTIFCQLISNYSSEDKNANNCLCRTGYGLIRLDLDKISYIEIDKESKNYIVYFDKDLKPIRLYDLYNTTLDMNQYIKTGNYYVNLTKIKLWNKELQYIIVGKYRLKVDERFKIKDLVIE